MRQFYPECSLGELFLELTDDERKQIITEQNLIFELIGYRGLFCDIVPSEPAQVECSKAILQFLKSKDDNLLLQIGGLLQLLEI